MKSFLEAKMKIDKVHIKHFKFHKKLELNLKSKNCLIYGENGTGKSSIYEALYANLYNHKRLNKSIDLAEVFKNRDFPTEDLEVNIALDNENTFNRKYNEIENINILSNGNIAPTIYFANEQVLNKLTKENFYIALNETLIEHFSELKYLADIYREFNNIERLISQITEDIEKTESKKAKDIEELNNKIRNNFEERIKNANEEFMNVFNDYIPQVEINQIIKAELNEDFQITFDITKAKSVDIDTLVFNVPNIKIKIDNINYKGNLHHHFNEAKLKLISIAIYFALAKKYEIKEEGGLKLLVLDDFLTSLDMANRKLIIQYVLNEFKKYQKVILTHNLQFDSLIKKLLDRRKENNDWNFEFLFITKEEKGMVAHLKDKNKKYLEEARKYFDEGEYQISGNFLRKEFESIAEELKQILELGKVESLNDIIGLIKNYNSKDYYFKPLTLINFIQEKISYLKSQLIQNHENQASQIGICKSKLNELDIKLSSESQKIQIESLVSIIEKVEFYKDINFNKASHREKEESYRKEVDRGIKLINQLNDMLQTIKGNKDKKDE